MQHTLSAAIGNRALQEFQFYDKYSRFNHELGRRETWAEMVLRVVGYLRELSGNVLGEDVYQEIASHFSTLQAYPSMRLVSSAGEAARRNNISIYNCSYVAVSTINAFVENLIISMSGCGLGFSVERRYVDQLPVVIPQTGTVRPTLVVDDSTEGWANALRVGLDAWFHGDDIAFDTDHIRPAGSVLHVKGGRASGPEPLRRLLKFAREKILSRQGGKLSPLDCHDLMCQVGLCVISGGVRRTALISLFDFDDYEMRTCKDDGNIEGNEQRWYANNSAVVEGELNTDEIRQLMRGMHESNRGEPGIMSRYAALQTIPDRREAADFGLNPCGEIFLRDGSFCNLSAAVARRGDTMETLAKKVRVASIIGTIQSTATDFHALGQRASLWQQNAVEERLLGVDINGQLDTPLLRNEANLRRLREIAVDTNVEFASRLGIRPSVAVTCVKPSGNSSILADSSSGIHPRWSPFYRRNVRIDASSPLKHLFDFYGFPLSPENGQTSENANTWVAAFPVKAPDGAICRQDVDAIWQLDNWRRVKENYTEHNPSATITYTENELPRIVDWLAENQRIVGGLTFLPRSNASYAQMPYEEITESEYNRMVKELVQVDYRDLAYFEQSDMTTGSQELACMSGTCEI